MCVQEFQQSKHGFFVYDPSGGAVLDVWYLTTDMAPNTAVGCNMAKTYADRTFVFIAGYDPNSSRENPLQAFVLTVEADNSITIQ